MRTVFNDLQDKGIIPTLFFLNAGLAGKAVLESPSDFRSDLHEKIFATNYFGVLYWVENWLPMSLNTGATFVVTGSINAIFAPPGGGGYAASKAAISKAFEGFALTYPNSNVTFSVVYAGPIASKGLEGRLPFTWKPEKMAKYMIKKALKKKTRVENSLFYSLLARLLRVLPDRLTLKLLGRVRISRLQKRDIQ